MTLGGYPLTIVIQFTQQIVRIIANMKTIRQFFRLLHINIVLMRYTFRPEVVSARYPVVRFFSYVNPWRAGSKKASSRGEAIRHALESLGPIFVKFGQLLSTRRDLLPEDIAIELAKLQDCVAPFAPLDARRIVEQAFGKNIQDVFCSFENEPLASASIAQVHAAELHTGEKVIVKILRPKITVIIRHDIALLYFVARLVERWWSQGKRLRPVALVAEFETTLLGELDLQREAANASQLRRNAAHSANLYVPKVYWEYVHAQAVVMERIYGVRLSEIDTLRAQGCDLKKLAEKGVETFFTQVFRDNFFHADMHPGNVFVDTRDPLDPKFILVDFGIMGSLGPADQHYLAENLIAFLDRDYRRVAVLHVESGWLPADTRIDQFEAAIRTVCEPIFEKPLSDISFGELLLRLFTTAEQFNMVLQPQLLLLQKTLLNVEGLGRQLYPKLDIWASAKPIMEQWLRDQRSFRRLAAVAAEDWDHTLEKIIKMPKLLYAVLERIQNAPPRHPIAIKPLKRRYFFLGAGLACLILALLSLFTPITGFDRHAWWPWISSSLLLLLAI